MYVYIHIRMHRCLHTMSTLCMYTHHCVYIRMCMRIRVYACHCVSALRSVTICRQRTCTRLCAYLRTCACETFDPGQPFDFLGFRISIFPGRALAQRGEMSSCSSVVEASDIGKDLEGRPGSGKRPTIFKFSTLYLQLTWLEE